MLRRIAIPCALALAVPSQAFALSQPDGTTIPVTDQLQSVFDAAGDPINALNDAADIPETFDPSCNLTFTMMSRGEAGFHDSFGWYNVTGAKPPMSDLHVLIDCNAQPPSAFPLAIKTDPGYLGGKIGFFMLTPEGKSDVCASLDNLGYVYYSEREYNPDNMGAGSYIHLMVYDSKKISKAFYFAWEDLFSGGDNNFTDFVARVDGISCAGGGMPCMTGKPGICATGVQQCTDGALACIDVVKPGVEACDGVDNDCNGKVDDGDLCAKTEVCDKGHCVPSCGGGEFLCGGGTTCDSTGHCVDPKCQTVTCPEGKVCTAGNCVGACDGVTCPHGEQCTVGVCADPCTGIMCETGEVCVGGACVATCDCTGCPTGQACAADGRCVAMACAMATCAAGKYCAEDGSCADPCTGAKCPGGAMCSAGTCAAPTSTGAGGAGGSAINVLGGGGSHVLGGGGKGGSGGGAGKGGTSSVGAGGSSLVVNQSSTDDGEDASSSGCGCETSGSRVFGVSLLWLAALPFLRRRREKRA